MLFALKYTKGRGINMGKNCNYCNKQLGLFNRHQLIDGNCLCNNCISMIPSQLRKFALSTWNFDTFKNQLSYFEKLPELRDIFQETHKYGMIHLDSIHGLFWLENGFVFLENALIFDLKYVKDFDFTFVGMQLKEGIFSDKVKGEVYFTINSYLPFYSDNISVGEDKASATVSGVFNKQVYYDLPEKVKRFSDTLQMSLALSQNDTDNSSSSSIPDDKELENAMSLFMIDDVSEITSQLLRDQRNKLLKTYHSDNGEMNEKYAQKINTAYDLLHKHIKGGC